MNKYVAVLAIIIIISLSAVCGVLLYQIGDLQTQNNDLQSQVSQLENEIGEFENQLSDLEDQNLELRNQTSELEEQLDFLTNGSLLVRITEFGVSGYSTPLFNNVVKSIANITVQNFGANDIEGLTLFIKHTSLESWAKSVNLGLLEAGEVRNIISDVYWSREIPRRGKFFAYVLLDDMILDKRSIEVFPIPFS